MQSIFSLPRTLSQDHRGLLFRLAVVLGCWALCLAAGLLAPNERFPLILAGAGGLVLALVSLYRMEWGLLILLLTTLWLRFSFTTGTRSPLMASLLATLILIGVWVLRMFLFEKRVRLVPSAATAPLILFGAVAVFSFLWSDAFPDARVMSRWAASFNVRLASLMVVLASVAVALLMANHLHKEKWFRIIVAMFAIAGLHGTVVGAARVFGGLESSPAMPLIDTLNTGGLFRVWVVALGTGQVLFNRKMGWWLKGILVIISALWWFYQTFFLGATWAVGWVTILIVLGVLSALHSRKLFLLFLLFLLVFVMAQRHELERIVQAENAESWNSRLAAWNTSLVMMDGHWFLGTGPAGYAAYYMTYIPAQAMATHSNYLDILAQFGLVGLGLIIWLIGAVGRTAIRTVRTVPRGGFLHGLAASLLAGFAASVVAMFLGDWVIPFAYTQGIAGFDYTVWGWLFMGGIIAVEQIIKRQRQGE